MTEFGEHWERKLRTCFKRFDSDGDGLLTLRDAHRIADNIIKAGQLTGPIADDIRNAFLEVWNKYVTPTNGGEVGTGSCEDFLENLKKHEKSDLEAIGKRQMTIFFEAVDTKKDGLIQLQEYINFFNFVGIDEEFAKEAFKELDTNHDGVLSREEFVTAGTNFLLLEEPSFPADLFFGSLV